MAKYILLILLLLTSCATIEILGIDDEICDMVCQNQHDEDMADFAQWYQKFLDNQYQIGVKNKVWTLELEECMTDSECEEAWINAGNDEEEPQYVRANQHPQ